MRRRDVLRGMGATLALGAAGGTASGQEESYEPLGRVEIDGATETVANEDGTVAYVAATTGFTTVDLTDPTDPELLAERRDILADREDGPMDEIHDVKVDGDRLAVVGPANAAANVLHGLALYDVSDPADPELVAFHETDFPNHNCYFEDGIVYLTGNDREGNPLVMVDVSDDDPEEVGRWSILDYDEDWAEVDWFLRVLHDVWVQDGLAYLVHWDAGTWIVDVSDPASPEFVSNFRADRLDELAEIEGRDAVRREALTPPGNDHYVQPSADGSIVAMGMESWADEEAGEGGPSGIELWDVSDLDSPERLSRIEAPPTSSPTIGGTWTTSHNFELAGDRLYSSWYQGGVKVFDVSDPTDPEELAWWREPDEAAFWTARLAVPSSDEGEGFFVASSYEVSIGIETALYTFPDRPGEQADPPALTETATPDEDTSDEETPSDGTATPTETPDGMVRQGTTASDGQPGFGVAATLAGLGAGAWRLLERK